MKHIQRVWVGFSDGKPHAFMGPDGVHLVAVYPTKWEAKCEYQDVRKAELIIEESPKRRSRSATARHE